MIGIEDYRHPSELKQTLDTEGVESEARLEHPETSTRRQAIQVHGNVTFVWAETEGARGRAIAVVFPVDIQVRDEAVQKTFGDDFARGNWKRHPVEISGSDGQERRQKAGSRSPPALETLPDARRAGQSPPNR